jgi:uncharacterized SAM-binding protein YcdF (DUF218 family)
MSTLKFRHLGDEVVVVVGGGVYQDCTPWPATRLRAEAAARLAFEKPQATVIVSGNSAGTRGGNKCSEATTMLQIIWLKGIHDSRFRIEGDSVDTIGNAVLASARFLYGQKPRPVTVVTSPFHQERAGLAFRGVLGPQWPVTIHPAAPAEDDAHRLTTESGGIDWMHRFFAPVPAGDLPAIVRRLFEVGKPYYKELPVLARLALKAS